MRFIYLFLALCIIAIPILLLNVPYVRARLNETEFLGYRSSADNLNGIAVRSLLWKSAWKLIKEKPILGYGHYSAQDRLREEYAKKGFEEGVKDDYNSHNQYLYSWLNYGIIGVMLISGYIFIFIKIAIRRKNLLMILFGLIFSIANITECMLQVQKGIVYFMLFSTLFLYHYFESGKLKISNNIYGES